MVGDSILIKVIHLLNPFILLGNFGKRSTDAGRGRTVRTAQLEENILNAVGDTPSTSTRKLSAQFNTSKTIVHEILKEQLLYPYHLQKVHELIPEDFPRRMQFANWLLNQQRNNANFISTILFTDEAGFSKNGIINLHNWHVWADENPHATIVSHHQHQFQQINVWAGIVGNFLIGPFVLPARLNGQLYLEFLQNDFHYLVEHLPLETRRNMYYMHDGAPPHFSVAVREHLNTVYPNRWIGRGGPIAWPPRSPDLTPLDFYLWGHLKTLVYSTPVESREELLRRITFHCDQIRNNVGLLWRVQQSSIRRARECIRLHGGHVEPSYEVFN